MTRFLCLLVLSALPCAVAAATCGRSQTGLSAPLEQGCAAVLQALNEGELEVAETALQALGSVLQADSPQHQLLQAQLQGELYFHRGQMRQAVEVFATARALAEQLGQRQLAQSLRIDEAIALRDSGELWSALQRFEVLRDELPGSYRLDANLATLYAQLGAPDLAASILEAYRLPAASAGPDRQLPPALSPADAADASVRLAQLHLDQARPELALSLLEHVLCEEIDCLASTEPALLDWWVLELAAEAARRSGQYDRAERLYQRLAARLPPGADQAYADYGLARVAVDLGRWQQARRHLQALHRRAADDELRWDAWALQLRSDRAEEVEAAQAQLEQALPALLAAAHPARVPEYRLRRRVQVLEALLAQWLRRGRDADLLAAFAVLPVLQGLAPAGAASSRADPLDSRRQPDAEPRIRQRQLAAREIARARARQLAALTEARTAPSESVDGAAAVWLIHEQTALLRIGSKLWQMPLQIRESDLVNHVDLLIADDPAWRKTAKRLYQQLGGALLDQACADADDTPAACRPGADLVIRSGPLLADFPFASLLDGQDRLLLQRFALRIDDRVPGVPRLPRDHALVVAHSGGGFRAPGPWWQRLGLPVLQEVRGEASEVARAWSARVLLAEGAAQPAAVQQALQAQPAVLHVAAHALLNPWRPQRSGLLLAAPPDGNPWWEAGAIADSQIQTELVVLAACQSARRASRWRGGLGGLADAFLQAGAASVIGSLWSVEDRATRLLMRELYDRLPDMAVAQALREAQLTALKRGQPPASWAAWVLRD